jgi:hypothetical protein
MKSQTPTWAIVCAILMMLAGGCGIKNDIQYINIKEMMSMKDKFQDAIQQSIEKDESDTTALQTQDEASSEYPETSDSLIGDTPSVGLDTVEASDEVDDFTQKMESMLDISDDTIQKIIYIGYAGLLFSLLYFMGGLFLLIKKSFSIQLAFVGLGLNIIFAITKWVILSGNGNFLVSVSNSMSSVFSIVFSLIMMIVIYASDKTHYEEPIL